VNIHFFEPPAVQRAGGLDAAIQSLRNALTRLGHEVKMNGDLPDAGGGACVHFHGLWQREFPALARRCTERDIPFVTSPHGMLEPWAFRHKWWKKWPYFILVERPWMKSAACILATGEPEAERLRAKFPRGRVESLPLGLTAGTRPDYVAARGRLGWHEDETVLLFLSRIHVKKGLDLLLSALAELERNADTPVRDATMRTRVSASRLVIVGPEEQPDYAARCREFAASNAGRLPRIEWAGAVWGDARWPYFRGADLFCLPTHSENFGLAVLEALQVGTPVLTTTATPWAASLAEGRGFIAEPDAASLREQLAKFFQQPRRTTAQRTALSEWAWANFDWPTLAPRYVALYQSLGKKTHHA
jgi:glycosyltransferase involved in cell wall biosynthesis